MVVMNDDGSNDELWWIIWLWDRYDMFIIYEIKISLWDRYDMSSSSIFSFIGCKDDGCRNIISSSDIW